MKRYGFLFVFTFALLLALPKWSTAQVAPGNVACQVYIPNAFTPNGDNINEEFVLQHSESCNFSKYSLKIFDRWGSLVFETDKFDSERGWDGTKNGVKLNKGVYMYRLQGKITPINPSAESSFISRQGTVVLIR